MNKTMAPVEDLRAHSVVKTGRRHQRYNDAQIRKRDGGGRGDGGGNGNNGGNENRGNDGNENGGNGGNENGGNGGRKNEDGNKNKSSEDDDGAYPPQQAQNSPYRYDDPPQQTYPLATATIQRTTTAWIAPPTTTVTVPATFSNSPSFQPQFNQPSSAAPSFVATRSSNSDIFPQTTLFPSSALPSSSQGRKGLEPFSTPVSVSASISTTTQWQATTTESRTSVVTEFPTAQLETEALTSTIFPPLPTNKDHSHQDHDDLSPTAQRLLVSAGTIGAVIIIVSLLYFLMKFRKIDLLGVFRRRPGNRFGFLKSKDTSSDDDNFIYADETPPPYVPEEKLEGQQQAFDGYFAPTRAAAPVTSPAAVAALSEKDPRRMQTPAVALPASSQLLEVSTIAETASINTEQAAAPVGLQRQASAATQNTTQAFYGGGTYEPGQKDQKYLSALSSLSSGFGDQIIIPEGPGGNPRIIQKPRDTYRQSRISWIQGNPLGSRDTVYTEASVESAPRFRTINSWVVQQSDRVERKQEMASEFPNMPEIPSALVPGHNRNQSEDPAFRAHPGDEIPIASGTRVPSGILDKKIGI